MIDRIFNFARQGDKVTQLAKNKLSKYVGFDGDFGNLAKDWWQPAGPLAPLHKINPLRAMYLDTHISLQGKTLLDVGCGGGLFSEAMAERGAKVTGIDPSEELIAAARSHCKGVGENTESNLLTIDYQCTTAAELIAKGGSKGGVEKQYDVVACLEVLEHLENPATLIRECVQLLKPGGWGYFSTINKTPSAFLLAIVGAEYVLRWLPRGSHSYEYFIKPAELCGWLRNYDMTPKHIKGLTFEPLSRRFTLSSNVNTNYLLLAQKDQA